MPSIPQSLLWISLVVLWLFVLVPMLINKRDTVRRTSDLALSTRVINSATRSRLLRRRGPATGHRHDPDWRPEDVDLDEDFQDYPAEDYDEAVREAMHEASARDGRGHTRSVMVLAAVTESEANTEPVYIDVDVVDVGVAVRDHELVALDHIVEALRVTGAHERTACASMRASAA